MKQSKGYSYLIVSEASSYSRNANAYQKIRLVADILGANILIPKGCRQWLPSEYRDHKAVIELNASRFAPVLYFRAVLFARKSDNILLLSVSNEITLFCAWICSWFRRVILFCWDPPGVSRRDETQILSRLRCQLMDMLMSWAVRCSNGLVMNLHPGFCERFCQSVRKKIWHFPNGTDVAYNRECAKGVARVPYRLAVNSAFAANKGCWNIARVYVDLWKKNNSVSLIWVGAGSAREAIKSYFCQNGIKEASFELGFFDHKSAIRKLATGSMALCMYENVPSLRWNYVLKAPEFLSLGIPIVAPRLPGVSQYVIDGSNGYLYDNEDEIVDTILDCFASRERIDQLRSSALKTSEAFDWVDINATIARKLYSQRGVQ